MKQLYSPCEIEIIELEAEDIITVSNETEIIDPHNDP